MLTICSWCTWLRYVVERCFDIKFGVLVTVGSKFLKNVLSYKSLMQWKTCSCNRASTENENVKPVACLEVPKERKPCL